MIRSNAAKYLAFESIGLTSSIRRNLNASFFVGDLMFLLSTHMRQVSFFCTRTVREAMAIRLYLLMQSLISTEAARFPTTYTVGGERNRSQLVPERFGVFSVYHVREDGHTPNVVGRTNEAVKNSLYNDN